MRPLNVLIFPGGTEIGLEIRKALCHCKEVRIFSAGMDVSNHAPYVFARHFVLPSVHEPNWIDRLNDIIREYNIDYVYPAYDDVQSALVKNAGAINAKIVSSPEKTCVVTRSKSATYELLADALPVPVHFNDAGEIDEYPVFLKPDGAQGSQGVHLVSDKNQLYRFLEERRDYIILEYLPGPEYTVDCFSDRDKGLLFCGGRERVRTRAGISMDSMPVDDARFSIYAESVSMLLEFHGAWFFQLKAARDNTLKLMEVAPRIAGTMAVNRVKGVNFPLLSLYEQERIPVEIMVNDIKVRLDRALINRYSCDLDYSSVYVDLDDTLVHNGMVNSILIMFLYQCINKGKQIILLTKHEGDLEQTLRNHRLVGLFDQVIHISQHDRKTDYIRGNDSIFIDDSFQERKTVKEELGIYTFDSSMIELLLDERM